MHVVPVISAWEPSTPIQRNERVSSPELGTLFSAYERVPKRAKKESVAREHIPYQQRIVLGPKTVDPKTPFRHAGLMSDIGGVQGFMNLVKGTHRIAEDWETISEPMISN
jgi:hypothetical protein